MANISYNQAGFTYNEQYASYHGFKSSGHCTSYNEAGLSYNEIGYPYHGVCDITVMPESANMTLSLPNSDVVFAVLFRANVLDLLLAQPQSDTHTTSNITVSPDALALVLSLPNYQVSLPKLVEVNSLSLTLSTPSNTVEAIRNVYLSPEVIELLLSTPTPGIEALQNLNFSIIPKLTGSTTRPEAFVQDVAIKTILSSVKIQTIAEPTNAQINNQGLTYNAAGYTYNDIALSYEGIYGDSSVVISPQIIRNIRPIFS